MNTYTEEELQEAIDNAWERGYDAGWWAGYDNGREEAQA